MIICTSASTYQPRKLGSSTRQEDSVGENMESVHAIEWLSLSSLRELDIAADHLLSIYDLIACAVRLDDMGKSEDAWSLLCNICHALDDFAADHPVNIRALLGTAYEYLNHDDEITHAFGAY